jgi:hypothetical protein
VGHVLAADDLRLVPNSPIFNISHTSGARMMTIDTDRLSSKSDRLSSKFDNGRSGKSGDQVLGLPVHLVPPSNVFFCKCFIV